MDVFSTVSGEVVKRQLIPSFIPIIPRDQVVHTGDTVLLKCQIRNLGPKSVSWLYKCNMNQGMIPTNYIFDSDLTPIVLTVHGFVFIHTAVRHHSFCMDFTASHDGRIPLTTIFCTVFNSLGDIFWHHMHDRMCKK